ncbi:hypothetical protein PF005_g650 [Phytophthora fragariae]|uniref:Serine protease n=1 Tax=Phytophthora fragariae TaxID=53985 RepID=A0A6A3TTB9_9STRA|nr:hypothetical protein PF003_g10381 [Phytophthora fragariae]KAE8949579.1 hypothetical protein PF009_g907 [Phytophthora fragariae]KAE9010582.1 hypothetical protein PF011_g9766 [Phytophthora fragariae]KAE9140189.1 hypothetical protein PF007_g767 [Phytophthora fragariae]KAE9155592.1 hypothetical protein PF006_g465 [Phytophthora fragariae]
MATSPSPSMNKNAPSISSQYFISPDVQEQVAAAVFQILNEDGGRIGTGVFFTEKLAVTSTHCLSAKQQQGEESVRIVQKEEEFDVRVVASDSESDCAILELPPHQPDRPYLHSWEGDETKLRGHNEFVVASFRVGFDPYPTQLGFAKAPISVVSSDVKHIMYCCATFAGGSGAPIVHKDGGLLGFHRCTANTARQITGMLREPTLDTCVTVVDNSQTHGCEQMCYGLLMSEVKKLRDSILKTRRS